mmetsp:Transcript_23987/g.66641  ORF Transcript_23987/g.66641 Transcript_23987/m.66641 type:complete len:559 (+) Transcript_23987:116-1792(+)
MEVPDGAVAGQGEQGGGDEATAGLLGSAPGSECDAPATCRPALKVWRNEGWRGYTRLCIDRISLLWPAYLGSSMEFYELVTYLHSGAALKANFLGDDYSSTWSSLGVWVGHGCTFLVRPLGGLLFGWMGDRYGRSTSMIIAMIGMSATTTLVGCIPSSSWGFWALLLLKVLQGLFVSGESPAAVVYSIEQSHPETACVTGTSLFVSAVYCGILFASLLSFAVMSSMPEQQYLAWGWRLPFLAALPMGVAVVHLRRRLPETEAFQRAQQQGQTQAQHHSGSHQKENGPQPGGGPGCLEKGLPWQHIPGTKASQLPWLSVLLGMACISANPAAAYGGLLYFPAFLSSTASLYSVRAASSLSVTGTLAGIVASPVCGVLGDLYGPELMIMLGSLLVALLSWPLWLLTVSSLRLAYAASVLWAWMIAFQGGTYATFLADMFPTSCRASGIGISVNVTFAIFGGLWPLLETVMWEAMDAANSSRGEGGSLVPRWLIDSCPALLLAAVGVLGLLGSTVLTRMRAAGRLQCHLMQSLCEGAEDRRVHGEELSCEMPTLDGEQPRL